jgi:hypothetical protein
MSRLYDITILGKDDPQTWITAAAFAKRDLRVAVVLDEAPDPGLPCFYWLAFDPSRNSDFVSPAGITPTKQPIAYLPDFQVIVAGKPVDFIADQELSGKCLSRDLMDDADSFKLFNDEILKTADAVIFEASDKMFPPPASSVKEPGLINILFGKKQWKPKESISFNQWKTSLTELSRTVIEALIVAGTGPLDPETSLSQAAVLFKHASSLHEGPGPEGDLRDQAADIIARRGLITEARPETILTQGKIARSVRLKGGAILDSKIVLAQPKDLYGLLDNRTDNNGKNCEPSCFRSSYFFKMEKTTIPESMAMRSVVVADPGKPLFGSNLAVLTRAPRVARRDTLAVTFYSDSDEMIYEEVPEILGQSLPWIDPAQITVDDTRLPVIVPHDNITSDFAKVTFKKPAIDNIFPSPQSLIPQWGNTGTTLSIQTLISICQTIIEKDKRRNW